MNFPVTTEPRLVTYLEHDIGTLDVWRKVVVLITQHDRDGVETIHLVKYKVICGLRGVEII